MTDRTGAATAFDDLGMAAALVSMARCSAYADGRLAASLAACDPSTCAHAANDIAAAAQHPFKRSNPKRQRFYMLLNKYDQVARFTGACRECALRAMCRAAGII